MDTVVTPTAETTATEPKTADPKAAAPATADPTTVDPATVDPATVDPTTVDPATVDPDTVDTDTADPSAEAGAGVAAAVVHHYTSDRLIERIKAALRATGVAPGTTTPADLKPVDAFHTGGTAATEALLDLLDLQPHTRVLDIGCGIGGTLRQILARAPCPAAGVDLTPAYVEAAEELSRITGLTPSRGFHVADARDLPYEDGAFDLVTMLHVGMNIADKAAMFREAGRVLERGGRFALYDLMAGPTAGAIDFPMPWAGHAALSFVAPPQTYRAAAAEAGLVLEHERDRSAFGVAFFEKALRAIETNGLAPLGIHLLIGEDEARTKLGNLHAAIAAGRLQPTEMIFEKP
ncbi:MAG: class I SAM-dependent methyltransferase [Pseudomonadota bacterium]